MKINVEGLSKVIAEPFLAPAGPPAFQKNWPFAVLD